MDDIELSAAREETILRAKLQNRAAPVGPVAVGECLFCEAELAAPRRWCEATCRDAWEGEARREVMRGHDENEEF